ncbi:probable glycerol uptake facilitator protein isoform X1 [Bolinopsis microptera]|uniref:probable glycerol uptake facilitator protein isoform X1 n=2 Tax=Bolinopsis microptera TaxID=2820187 RepID=UPI003079845B
MASEGAYREIASGSGSQSKPKMSFLGGLRKFFDKEFAAEFLSTLILVLLGDGSVAQYKMLNKSAVEPFLSINIGYACAVTFGCYIAAGVSGAHMNPAVTIALAVVKKFKWNKVPKYITAQMLGGFFGALLVFITYVDRLLKSGDVVEEESFRGIFATYPHPDTTTGGQLLDQVVGTFLLMLIVCSLGDNNNSAPPKGVTPILVGGAVLSIGLSFGTSCGYAINPARDFAPRLATALLGYDHVFSADNYYFWIPIIGPIIGAILGAVTYLVFIEQPGISCIGQKGADLDPSNIVSNGASEIELEKTAA